MLKNLISVHLGRLSAVQLGLEGGIIGNFIGNSPDWGGMKNR